MKSSYKPEDVTILLKDITGLVEPLDSSIRERLIQSGTHYSEMLPREYPPSPQYLAAYKDALHRYAQTTADAVAVVAERIYRSRQQKPVLVSLARAGTPIGILIKRYLEQKYNMPVPHYTISIIRGKGIDKNAIHHLLTQYEPQQLQFVDGWTGKGAIQRQLDEAMHDFPAISSGVAVLSDPACVAEFWGTREDFLIASSCLNSTVSGLISRTFFRTDLIGPEDFHGAMYYEEFAAEDLTYEFIDTITAQFRFLENAPVAETAAFAYGQGLEETKTIAAHFSIADINLVKPGIGETTRVLLRRIPWKILVHSLNDEAHLGHIYRLAAEKGVPVEEYPLVNYRACGLIRKLADS
ncbi:MAG: cysteine protease StiP family protein [Oscillospiraceae bacterium]|nr:cysteine protease StiP family protein [Oscillospiraceae bacterium]